MADVAPAVDQYRPDAPVQNTGPDELSAATARILPVPPVAHVDHSVGTLAAAVNMNMALEVDAEVAVVLMAAE